MQNLENGFWECHRSGRASNNDLLIVFSPLIVYVNILKRYLQYFDLYPEKELCCVRSCRGCACDD